MSAAKRISRVVRVHGLFGSRHDKESGRDPEPWVGNRPADCGCASIDAFRFAQRILRIPRLRSGNRLGQYSIRINDQWRVCFRWSSGDAWDVEIVDYH